MGAAEFAANRRIIDESGEPYEARPQAFLFRHGTAMADFYPSTGRWRDVYAQDGTRSGGARAFLEWWAGAKVRSRPLRPPPERDEGWIRGGPPAEAGA